MQPILFLQQEILQKRNFLSQEREHIFPYYYSK